ncbi:Enoyl-CoA delta isomerase 1 [Chelonia mydas]|uniref:Enoyl-CoA delta isomerase 1, mitochondrial n=1 Tax=Chelonia mydas TaxID=8469 RepID=M7BBD6_CHEMY|nr:Enoyl-CoA delta isomerase 1 [Chelonia mydas]
MKMENLPVNSLSLDFLTEFLISLEKLENDRGCRGVILTSGAPKIFSAGLDIMEMYGKSAEHYAEFWKAVQEMWLRLYQSNMVTIAAINAISSFLCQGSSPAGGCLMAMSCDYRIMAENPKYSIGLNETQLGIVAPFWFKDTMVNTIGNRATERSLELGLLYSPPEAHKIGLVDQPCPSDITKSMMRKPTVDRLLAHRESDIQNFVSFITKDSIQKSLQMYMEMLKQRRG